MLLFGGCATYTDILSKTHNAADSGDYETGIRELNDILGVDSFERIPDEWTAHRPLAALERSMLLQARNQYEWSARDLSAAETELEFLDLKLDAVGNIGKYIYNDSAEIYKAQPTERLALNALNMLNYLAMDNLEGAGVEARRFTLAREYLESLDEDGDEGSHGAFGSYLAGFVFEKLGEPDRALRYYEEALDAGDLQAFREPVLRLSAQGNYVGRKMKEYLTGLKASDPSGTEPDGDILIILGLGRVPYKVPKRIPVGAAVGYAGMWVTGNPEVLGYSALKVVIYPELVKPNNMLAKATVSLDGREVPVELLTDLDSEIAREYETIKPKIIGAALTRMIARAAAAEGARAVARKKGGATAMLAALATEATLVGLDKPDTRSWTFLPARLYVCRARVKSGRHEISVNLFGRARETRTIKVEVPPKSFSVVVITEPR
jgi:tetratricopeptide (TPR) repeat protein